MTDSKPVGPGKRPDLKWLPIDRLSVDHRYQRTLESRRSEKLVDAIAADFKWAAFQSIQATPDGKRGWLVIDGQHRVEAPRRRGIKEVPATVIDAASLADQAAAFVRANTQRVAVNNFALHRASVTAGDRSAIAVDRLCKAAGIEIPAYPIPADKLKPGQTLALATIARLPARFGDKVAADTLRTVGAAYADRAGALRAPVIQAVALLLREAERDERVGVADKIREHLARTDPTKLAVSALSMRGRSGGTEFAALVQIIRKAIESERRATSAGSGFIKPPTRDQLMGRR